jgi:hypothetical protein
VALRIIKPALRARRRLILNVTPVTPVLISFCTNEAGMSPVARSNAGVDESSDALQVALLYMANIELWPAFDIQTAGCRRSGRPSSEAIRCFG